MKYSSQIKSMPLDLFTPDLAQLPKDNRWVKLGDSLPWDKIELIYNSKLSNGKRGAGNKPARMIIGALLIKHKLNLSDEETIQAIRENPYMQYMLGCRAKLSDTGESWCAACYFAKNVMKFLKELLHALFEMVSRCWNLVIEAGKFVTLTDYQMLCVNVANI